ncbi:AAA family ATPase [Candidatus Parcubacteria bacterium]|nr:MAG: AAA family ATPase [Candidatus Parcubacteria bacterium]
MLTKVTVRNFKRFEQVELELGNAVVFIGPNNSGKTAALQSLALWDIGVKRWVEKRGVGEDVPQKRPGVTINRRDLIAVPVPNANLLWRNRHVRDVQRVEGKQRTQNIRIEIIVEGVTQDRFWRCGMEFDYANEESFYCRPLRLSEGPDPERMPVPIEANQVQIAYLPPMSGLAANETRLDPGAINVRVGEGRTAEVLRNLCYQLVEGADKTNWQRLQTHIHALFGVTIEEPQYIPERGEITMTYRDLAGVRLDLSSSGRGLQQVLLLLAYLYAHPGAVLLLDEPDAHLEILRQRQIYHLLTDVTRRQNGQVIAASHSEIVLNEAADRDIVIAFVGQPHRIDDRGSQLLKSLREIGYDQYYQAEQTGWVLYLEGSTDLAILKAFAEKLKHPAVEHLERPFVHYVANQPTKARAHFNGLREAQPNLVGIAIFDHLETNLQTNTSLRELMWQRREIENYLCMPPVLLAYAEAVSDEETGGPLFTQAERERRRKVMDECIRDLVPPVALRNLDDRWWREVKASDEFLDRLFEAYFAKLGLPNLMRKSDYHLLAQVVPQELIDSEVREKLDAIVLVAESAHKLSGDDL